MFKSKIEIVLFIIVFLLGYIIGRQGGIILCYDAKANIMYSKMVEIFENFNAIRKNLGEGQ